MISSLSSLSLSDMTDAVLSWLLIYGPSVLALALFLGAIGLPLPGSFLVVATGAFVGQGVLGPYATLIWALVGVVIGDSISYGIGRFARGPILRRFGHLAAWRAAEENMRRRGGIAIYLTRWLLTAMAVPTNLAAGSGGYPFRRFLAYDVAGELTWLLLYGTVGYAFMSQWEAISELIESFSGVLVGAALLAVGVYLVLRWSRSPRPVVTGVEAAAEVEAAPVSPMQTDV